MANRNPGRPEYYELYVLAAANVANAFRSQDENRRAEELFALARRVMDQHGVTDPAVIARVDDLVGSLRKDQRRFPEAERLLKRAAVLYGLARAPEDHARVLINLADSYCARGALEPAIETVQTVLGLLGPASDPFLRLCAHYNLTYYLVSAGRLDEAADQLEADEALYRCFPEPWAHLRLLWLQGDIASGKGDLAAAERFYRATREGFIAHHMAYDAAMVSLDLAILYLKEERVDDVQRLAEEMLPIFHARTSTGKPWPRYASSRRPPGARSSRSRRPESSPRGCGGELRSRSRITSGGLGHALLLRVQRLMLPVARHVLPELRAALPGG